MFTELCHQKNIMKILKKVFIYSCIHKKAIYFLPFLHFTRVKVDSVYKYSFYKWFRHKLCCMSKNSIGKISFKVTDASWYDKDFLAYNFYDEVHTYSRLTVLIKETEGNLYIDVFPF